MEKETAYVAVGNNEIPGAKRKSYVKRTEELLKQTQQGKDPVLTEDAGRRLLSLILSRGKTEDGRHISCEKCKSDYIVFSDEEKYCGCGNLIQKSEVECTDSS